MEATGFHSLREKRVFPQNDITVTLQVRATYRKRCVAVLRIRGCLHCLSSPTRSRVIAFHNFEG